MGRLDLTDEEWAIIAPLMPTQGLGPRRKDDRSILNGIFYILRTGAPWRDLPERYGPRTTVYNRYNRWGNAAFGRVSSRRLSKNARTHWSSSTLPSLRLTAHRLDQKRGTGRRYWPLTRRSHEQSSRSCGRSRTPAETGDIRRSGPR